MAGFSLGNFLVSLTVDSGGASNVFGSLIDKVKGLGSALKSAVSGGVNLPGAPETKQVLSDAADAGQKLHMHLLDLSGINLENVLKLGTLAGIVGLIKETTQSYMDMQDEMKNVEIRFRTMGMEGKKNSEELFEFGKQMQETFGIAASEGRKMAAHALEQGVNPARYKEMAASAVALAATTGKSTDAALRAIEQMEAGNMRGMAQMHTSIKQMVKMGASRIEIESQVNRLIGMGAEIQKERLKTYAGQVEQLKQSFTRLKIAVGSAIGPAIAPMIQKVSTAMQSLAGRIEEFVKNHGEMAGQFVRVAGGVSLAVFALTNLKGRLGTILKVVKMLIPGFGLLQGALSAGWNFDIFSKISSGFRLAFSGLMGLPGLARQVAVSATAYLLQAFVTLSVAVRSPIGTIKAGIRGIRGACVFAAGGLGILKMAIRGLLLATGVGILFGLVGAIAGAVDTFGEAAGAADGLSAAIQAIGKEAMEYLKPVMAWIKVEGVIIFKAFVSSARQMIDNVKILWGDLQQTWAHVMAFMKENFSGVINWINGKFGTSVTSVKDLWAEFTAELAIIGLRIRLVFLGIIVTIHRMGYILQWVAEVAIEVVKTIILNFSNPLVSSLHNAANAMTLIGTAAADVGTAIAKALRGESFSFDFSKTEAAFKKLKDNALNMFNVTAFKLPEFRIDQMSSGLKSEFDRLRNEIDGKKQQAREAQAIDRTKKQDTSTGKTSTAPQFQTGVVAGNQDKAHFSDTAGFWKKIQEAGASSRSEHLLQQQIDQQREMTRILGEIKANTSIRQTAPSGVVPR